MFIKTETGIYNLDHFDSMKIVKNANGANIVLLKQDGKEVVIDKYDSYKEACKAYEAVAESLDYADEIVYLCGDDDEDDVSTTEFSVNSLNYIVAINGGGVLIFPKEGSPFNLPQVETVKFV